MHLKQRCQSSRFLSRQGSTAFGGQNIENPVEIEVPKISSQDSVEAVKNVRHERTSEGSGNRFWLSNAQDLKTRTECCSVQSSRLSTSLVSRVNKYNNVLPNLINMAKSWTPCSESKERSRITLPASSVMRSTTRVWRRRSGLV